MAKKIIKYFAILLMAGCAAKPVTTHSDTPGKPASSPVLTSPAETPKADLPPITPSTPAAKNLPKIAIIFSGGGAKAWAHIGVIREFEKAKWPIFATAGFEWGAAVAALYANNLSSSEVEWELGKLKDVEDLDEVSRVLFNNKSVSDFKVPFVCPSLNIAKQSIFLLNRGQLSKLLPFCLAQPPLSKPYGQSVAEMSDIASLAQHLRATGANKIVLINVLASQSKRSFLPDFLSAENILWANSAGVMSKKIAGVDEIISINLDDYAIKDIDKKREIIAKGSELSYDDVKKLTKKFGL